MVWTVSVCMPFNGGEGRSRSVQLHAIFELFDRSNLDPKWKVQAAERLRELIFRPGVAMKDVARGRNYMARAYASAGDFEQAHKLMLQTEAILDRDIHPLLLGRSLLEHGGILRMKKDVNEAIAYYVRALTIAKEFEIPELYQEAYSSLADLFARNKVYDKAAEFSAKAYEWSKAIGDSNLIMKMRLTNLEFNGGTKDSLLDLDQMRVVINYALRRGNIRLSNYAFALIRSNLTALNKLDDLRDWCLLFYPEQFTKLRKSQPQIYFRTLALIAENDGEEESARAYFEKAKVWVLKDKNPYMVAHFFKRYGEFLYRLKDIQAASRTIQALFGRI